MHERLCSIWWLSHDALFPLRFQFGALHCVLENILSIWQKLPCYHNSRGPSPSLRSNPVTTLSLFRRLAKSTLLLIPLFGIHYVVFVYIMEGNGEMENYKIFFDLGLGSFQGLVVAILYCFLNSEVQSELKRKWRSLRLKRYIGRDYRLHSTSISRNGTENMTQFHRNSRAQSFLQTETTVMWDIQKRRYMNHALTSLPLS